MEPTKPTTSETPHEQHMRQRQDHLAHYRALVDEHVQLAQQLRDQHERYLALQSDPGMGAEERRAQTAEIVSAESEVLKRAEHVLEAIQEFLNDRR